MHSTSYGNTGSSVPAESLKLIVGLRKLVERVTPIRVVWLQ